MPFVVQSNVSTYEQALKAFNNDNNLSAVIHLKNTLQQSPDYTPARILLGKIYLTQEDYLPAQKELTQALNENGDWTQILPLLVECKINLHKTAEGLALINQYQHQHSVELLTLKAKLMMQMQDYQQAKIILDQAIVIDPDSIPTQLELANLLEKKQDYNASLNLLEQILEQDKTHLFALLLKAKLLENLQRLAQAEQAYNKVLNYAPDNTLAKFGKASLLQKMQRGDEALTLSLELREKLPNNPFAKLLHAVIAGANKSPERDVKEILYDINTQLSVVDPKKVPGDQVYLLSGYVNYLTQKYDLAKRDFLNFKLSQEDDITIYKLLAETEIKRHELKQAYLYYYEYIERKPDDEKALAKFLSLARKNESLVDYQAKLESALQQFPNNLSFRNHLAAIYIASDKPEKARALINADEKSNVYLLDLQLANLLLEINEIKAAGLVTSNLLTQQPLNPRSHHMAAKVYIKAGDIKKANFFIDQALQIKADFSPSLISKASLAINQNDYKTAASILEKIPNNISGIHQLKASIAIHQTNYPKAISELELAYQNSPDLKTAKALIELYLRVNSDSKAKQVLASIIKDNKLDPELIEARIKIALINSDDSVQQQDLNTLFGLYYDEPTHLMRLFSLFDAANQVEGQHRVIKRLENIDSVDQTQLLFLTTQYQINTNNFNAAEKSFMQLKNLSSDLNSIHELEFNLANGQQDFERAEKIIKNLYQNSKSAQHFKTYIGVLINQQNWPDAELKLTDWLTKFPQDLAATYLLSRAYLAQNKQKQAIDLLEASNAQQTNALTLHKLANLYQKTDLKLALSKAQQAVELAPKNPAFNDTYGWLLHLSDQNSQALHYLRLAQASNASQPDLIYHLAATLSSLNRQTEAKDLLKNLLKRNIQFKNRPNAIKLNSKL